MKCHWHPLRKSTHCVQVPDEPRLLLACDECAVDQRQGGLEVRKHYGFLFGLPIVKEEFDDGVLNAEYIDDKVN